MSTEKSAALNESYPDVIDLVCHELKGILVSTSANVYSVREGLFGVINPRQRKALDLVIRNLNYLAVTVEKFLNLSRIEKGELTLKRTEVCLREDVFDSSLEIFAEMATQKGMEVVNNIQSQMRVNCDADLMLLVANNLVSNAIKYGLDKGNIVLSSKDLGDKVQIEIYNDSRPIKGEEKAKLFKKFSRLCFPENNRVKGTGLGLFITRGIITKHGGNIWVKPREHGNSFIFQIEKDRKAL